MAVSLLFPVSFHRGKPCKLWQGKGRSWGRARAPRRRSQRDKHGMASVASRRISQQDK